MIRSSLIKGLVSFSILLLGNQLLAQDQSDSKLHRLSMKQAIEHAIQNNIEIKNAQLDAMSATARVGEIRAIGLPQVNAGVGLQYNPLIRTQFLPAIFFDQNAPSDAPPVGVRFGVTWVGDANVSVNQLLFDGSYIIGLRAASTYKQLAQKQLQRSKIDVAEAVTKAYYLVLITDRRLNYLQSSINSLDSTYHNINAMYKNGFAEQIDVTRIEVALNNLRSEKSKAVRLQELTLELLKFQMGVDTQLQLELTDKLNEEDLISMEELKKEDEMEYSNRIEYSVLQTQKELAGLDMKNVRAGYLPRLSASATYGFNSGSDTFTQHYIGGDRNSWFRYGFVGVNLAIPIFDGLSKYYKTQQAKLTYQKTEQSLGLLKKSIDLEIKQAKINVINGLANLEIQKKNMDLAAEVVRVTKIKFEQGVGSNIEVINAEDSFRQAQTNYFDALYDTMIAKIDLQKAEGTLLND